MRRISSSAAIAKTRKNSKRQEGFWKAADTFGLAAVETFVKSPKQERRVNRLYDGAGVPGYSGAAKKTAACAGMTL